MKLALAFSLMLSANAFATVKPEVPQNPPTSESYASASSNSAASVSNVQGGNAHVSANTGDSNANNTLSIVDRDVRQAPGGVSTPVFASGPCTVGGSVGLSGPGFGVTGGKARSDEACNLREMVRILTALNPRIALKLACTDPAVKAVAGDCELPPTPPAPQPCAVCEPKDSYTKKETDERIEKAFRSTVAK